MGRKRCEDTIRDRKKVRFWKTHGWREFIFEGKNVYLKNAVYSRWKICPISLLDLFLTGYSPIIPVHSSET
jgi:hypothetical protein